MITMQSGVKFMNMAPAGLCNRALSRKAAFSFALERKLGEIALFITSVAVGWSVLKWQQHK